IPVCRSERPRRTPQRHVYPPPRKDRRRDSATTRGRTRDRAQSRAGGGDHPAPRPPAVLRAPRAPKPAPRAALRAHLSRLCRHLPHLTLLPRHRLCELAALTLRLLFDLPRSPASRATAPSNPASRTAKTPSVREMGRVGLGNSEKSPLSMFWASRMPVSSAGIVT